LILTSKHWVTHPHNDLGTPGTSILTVHKGRKIFICLESQVEDENLTLFDFFDRIIQNRNHAYMMEIRKNDCISFPADSIHVVLTLENSVASYYTALHSPELDHMKKIGYQFSISRNIRNVKKIDHICWSNGNFDNSFTIESVYAMKMELSKAIPFCGDNLNIQYSFNDLFYFCSKLLTEKNVSVRRFYKGEHYHPNEHQIFLEAGIDTKILRLAFHMCLMIHDLMIHEVEQIDNPNAVFVCGTSSSLSLYRGMGTIIPILKKVPELGDARIVDTFRARFCRNFCFQKSLLLRKLILNIKTPSIEIYKGIPVQEVILETEKDLLDHNLLPASLSFGLNYYKPIQEDINQNELEFELKSLTKLKQKYNQLVESTAQRKIWMYEFLNISE
jgi:hypothetical protein